jgi:hypothetical protein
MKKAANGKPDQNKNKMAAAMADMQALEPPEEPRQRRFKTNESADPNLPFCCRCERACSSSLVFF